MLETCDITTDNNYFIQTKGTGSKPPGELSKNVREAAQKKTRFKFTAELTFFFQLMKSHTSQISLDFLFLTDPVVFESYYHTERVGNVNGQAHFAPQEDESRWDSSMTE